MRTIQITNKQANYILRAIDLAHETMSALKSELSLEDIDSGCLAIMKAINDQEVETLTDVKLAGCVIKANRELFAELLPDVDTSFYDYLVVSARQKIKKLTSESASMILSIANDIAERELGLELELVD